jgi:outer membrane protein TolC
MKNRKGALFLWVFLFFQGCIDYRGAQNPDQYTPPNSQSTWNLIPRKRVNEQAKIEEYDYVTKADPFSLAEAIDVALLNNPSTKETWATCRSTAAKYGQSLKNDFILADGGLSYERTRFAEFASTPSSRQIILESIYDMDLSFSYLVFDFGQTRFSSLAALQSLFNANWTHNSEIQRVIREIMLDYYNYLLKEQLLKAARADVDNAKLALDAVLEKRRTGLADVSEQMQATTNLLQQQLNVVTQKQALHTAYTKLITDMGVPSKFQIDFEEYPDKRFEVNLASLNEFVQEALNKRPDIIASEANLFSKEAALKAAKRKLFPTLSSSFDFGRSYYHTDGTTINDDYNFSLIFSLNYPLFQGFFLRNGVKQAKAEYAKAMAQLQQKRLSVVEEVSNTRENVILADEAVRFAKSFLEASEEEFKVSLEKYRVGTNTIVELMNALTSVADARAKFAESERDWYSSLADLRFAIGFLSPKDLSSQKVEKYEKCSVP